MRDAAAAFLASLDDGLRAKAQFAFAAKERTEWNFVPGSYPGVVLGELSLPQRRAAHALLRSALSARGYLKVTSIFALDLVLRQMAEERGGKAPHRDPERYAFAVFGTPSAESPWGWRVQGHHVSIHFTAATREVVAVTPAFLGANPAEVREGPSAGLRVLAAEEDLARALLTSLAPELRARAVIEEEAPADVILGPGRRADLLGAPKGLPGSAMDASQCATLALLLDEYARNLRPELAEQALSRMGAADLGSVHFAWAGSLEPGKPHYYRLHGPTFVIEYDNTQDGANHVHTVWRDLTRDFGADALRDHLEHDHK